MVASGQLAIALPIAVLAGIVSFASPCILPLVPGYLGYLGGFDEGASVTQADRRQLRLLVGVALFVLGFAAVFVLGGFLFGALGWWLAAYRDVITRVAGIVVILLGRGFLGRLSWLQTILKPQWRARSGLGGAPLLGVAFAIGWSPCTGPTLAAISTLSLSSGSGGQGAVLAAGYALGLGIPFLVIALGFGWAARANTFLRAHMRQINLFGGAFLILIGVLMVTGVWNELVLRLQEVLPYFQTAV
jgi:cytochrome c-type biogenesis protein